MICPTCSVDIEKTGHEDWCPNNGVCDEVTSLKRIMSIGWSCPKCSRVWSPLTRECAPCNKKIIEPEEE